MINNKKKIYNENMLYSCDYFYKYIIFFFTIKNHTFSMLSYFNFYLYSLFMNIKIIIKKKKTKKGKSL